LPSTVFGLPAHVLLVHAAVVFVPVAAAVFIAIGWRKAWRQRYGLIVSAIAVIGFGATFFAQQTGGALRRSIRSAAEAAGAGRVDFGSHPQQGNAAMLAAFLFAAATVVVVLIDRRQRSAGDGSKDPLPVWAPSAAYAVAAIPALLAIITMVAAGHSGATLVWHSLGNYVHS
jgi:phosphoglycerol transferase MdoB-like AlkP superfamily enzyme